MRRSIMAMAVALPLMFAAADARQGAEITTYALPAGITFPEGIAHDASQNAIYTGSAETGAVVRMTLPSKQTAVVAPAGATLPAEPFPALLGMKIDGAGRLWVAGGRTGRMAVLDAKTGRVLKKFETPNPSASLINDVVIVGSSAYFTDSLVPTLWRVTVKGNAIGDLEPWLQFAGSALEYTTPGANLNGIAATADGRHLITVQMNKGILFRIGVADKTIAPIDIGGEAIATADGLVLDGRTLYIVRQGEQEIVTVTLSDDLAKGRVVSRFKNAALQWPATAAKAGNQLLVVNTQFNKRGSKDPSLPFSIVGVPLSMLGPK